LTGKYALARINGRQLPADDGVYNIYYDTLVFLPQYMYRAKDSVSLVSDPNQRSARVTDTRSYIIVSDVDIELPTVYAGQVGGVMQAVRTNITWRRETPDGPLILRWDRVP
jgi:hypothetical protein